MHEAVLGCDKLSAMGQEEAIRRLSDRRSPTSKSDRMRFIGNVAKQYHKLMEQQKNYIEGEIYTISTWMNK
ncbi:DUF2515 family protein [Pseudomonas sp. ICMP 460]|uniref:DUF2515 family protein n=1 Tax=Pseudomonas sp. ICMP 460 TaxID=1718917 RepID=UPI00117B1573|nr:hypothetical protein [Pseudomonas sp. ICMP 460]